MINSKNIDIYILCMVFKKRIYKISIIKYNIPRNYNININIMNNIFIQLTDYVLIIENFFFLQKNILNIIENIIS